MFKLRNTFCLLMALIVIAALCACNSQEVQVDDVDEDTSLIVVGFSQPGAESAWRVALTDSVKEAFTEDAGFKLIYKDGQSKQDNQIRDIRTFIQQGVEACRGNDRCQGKARQGKRKG